MPETLSDLMIVKDGLRRLRFMKSEIKVLTNPDYDKLKANLDDTYQLVY